MTSGSRKACAVAETTEERPRYCPACGKIMRIFVRLKKAESRAPIACYKCEQCAHILVVEE